MINLPADKKLLRVRWVCRIKYKLNESMVKSIALVQGWRLKIQEKIDPNTNLLSINGDTKLTLTLHENPLIKASFIQISF